MVPSSSYRVHNAAQDCVSETSGGVSLGVQHLESRTEKNKHKVFLQTLDIVEGHIVHNTNTNTWLCFYYLKQFS